jgi:transglutaminase-like putative cysteine protease
MRRICTAIFMLVLATLAKAQPNYDVSLIPKTLLPYASAVVRSEEVNIEVKDYDNTVYHIKKAITVINKNGDDIARIVLWYNKTNVIRNLKGTTYNEFGKPIGKFTERELIDESATASYSLFDDSRVKHFIPSIGAYPYTIEYEYELRSKQSLNFSDWAPNDSPGLAVEKSTFTFTCNPTFDIRYKEINMPGSVSTGATKDGLKTYTWQVTNMKAFKNEPYSPNEEEYLSLVKIAPQNFKYEGLSGSFNNWKELGRWTYDKLLANRRELPPATVQYIKDITAGINNPKLKAKKIYEYMQGKTRYISVQVGIGGYRPFLASDVDRTSYGDCKALVNYTQALLNAVGIESWYCVVEAGSRKVSLMPDFASMDQGNHIILCLPFKNDTTFLECTSQKIPFGYLSDFTDDRNVLACTPQGGKLMRTTKYTAQVNLQLRKADFVVDNTGLLIGNISTVFKGTQYDNRGELLDEPRTEQLKLFPKLYPAINNLDVQSFDFKEEKNVLPIITETIKLNARDFATTDNGKIYFSLNPLNRTGRAPREVRNRTTALYINSGYTDEDEITYKLPTGYKVEFTPLDVTIDNPFGKFLAKMAVNGDKLTFKRRLQLLEGTYSKELYSQLVEFYQQVADADNYNVTLVKN